MSTNNTINTKLKFQDLLGVPDNQKLTAAEFNQLPAFQKSPVQQIAGSLDDTDIIIDGTKNYGTTIVVAGATRTITANASGHLQGNNIKQRYQFDVDCTLTLTNFDATGNNTGTIAPIPAGTYDFQYFANRNGRNLEIAQNIENTKLDKIKTANQSVESNVNIKKALGLSNDNPDAPIHVGSGADRSGDAQVIAARTLGEESPGNNGHCFSDSSIINRSGGSVAYNSFDARIKVEGTQNYDHFASFQDASEYNSSGTLSDMYSLFSTLIQNGGIITNRYGVHVANVTINSGTLVNNYGIFVASLNVGTNKWAIKTNAGKVDLGDFTLIREKLHVGTQADDGTTENFLVKESGGVLMRIWSTGQNLFDFSIPSGQTHMIIADISDTFMKFNNNAGVESYYNGTKTFETVSGGAKVTGDLEITGSVVKMANLPTSDPVNAGQLWNDSGTMKISTG